MKVRPARPMLVDQYGKPMALFGAWGGARTSSKPGPHAPAWGSGTAGSPDEDNNDDLPRLRARSRQLMRENPLAGGAINTACKSVVGTGLNLRAEVDREILGWDEETALQWEKKAEKIFSLWARTKASDWTLGLNFWEQQDLAFRTTLESGDAVALFCYRKHASSPFGLAVQLVEGDRLCNENGKPDSASLVAGVVLNAGAPWGYHIADQHPGSRQLNGKRTWSKRPAFSPTGRRIAQHLFMRLRPDQHRGVPYLSPVIDSLRQLGEYTEGELRAAVVSGLYTAFITRKTPVDPETGEPGAVDAGDGSGDLEMELGYGVVRVLDDDEDVKPHTPGRPNIAFDPFVLAVLRQIGTALEIPYEILIQHFTASYSAARAALLELGKFIRRRRDWLAANFCQPCYEALLEEAVAARMIDAPGFFTDPMKRLAYCGATWGGDSLGMLNPDKEASAYKLLVDEFGLPESEALAALTGNDWDRSIERSSYEKKKRSDLNLVKAQAGAQQASKPGVQQAGQGAAATPEEPNPDASDQESA